MGVLIRESQDVVVLIKTWVVILQRLYLAEVEDFRALSGQVLLAQLMYFQLALVEVEDLDNNNPNSKESETTLK
jgi:hypothetical protein